MEKRKNLLTLLLLSSFCLFSNHNDLNLIKNEQKCHDNFKKQALKTIDNSKIKEPYEVSLGRGINAIKATNLSDDLKIENSIFDTNWLNNQINNCIISNISSYHQPESVSGNTLMEIQKSFNSSFCNTTSLDYSNYLFNGMINSRFSMDYKKDMNYGISNYFYHQYYVVEKYLCSLPSINHKDDYVNHLDLNYIKDIENLSDYNSYANFFDTYGTHFVVKGTYGGSVSIDYIISSNSVELSLNNSIGAKIDASVKATLDSGVINCKSSSELKDTFNEVFKNYEYKSKLSTHALGGKANIFSFDNGNILDNSKIIKNITEWQSSLEDNYSLIKIGLMIPLWEYLPNNLQDKKDSMKKAFYQYAIKNSKFNIDQYSISEGDVFEFNSTFVKKESNGEHFVNNDNSEDHRMNKINISYSVGDEIVFSPKLLAGRDYKKAYITIDSTVINDKDANQDLFVELYSINRNGAENFLYRGQHYLSDQKEENIAKRKEGWWLWEKEYKYYRYPVSFTKNTIISITDLIDKDLIIKFKSSNGANWKVSKVSLKISYSLC